MEYDTMIANIQHYIRAKKDFFVGGRGVGIACRCMAIGWKVEIERAYEPETPTRFKQPKALYRMQDGGIIVVGESLDCVKKAWTRYKEAKE